VSDKVEVRCYKPVTGAPVNTRFTLLVSRAAADRAFAFGNQPTAAQYSPSAPGSWNPAGPIKVIRIGVGHYHVVFANLGTPTNSGQALVNAVGMGKAFCTLGEFWGGASASSDLALDVSCFNPAGAPVDSRFSVAFLRPAKHLAYAFGDSPFGASYSPDANYATNPAGGAITITRDALGQYIIWWAGVDTAILAAGNVQVSGVGSKNQCKVASQTAETAFVKCYGANGALTDSYFSVLLGS
jgi:hypothetical protein